MGTKKIKPSKRHKKRYIVFEVISNMNKSSIYNVILKSAINLLGSNYKKANIRFLKDKYIPRLHRGIIRVNNKYAKEFVNALNKDKNLKTIGMSGILRKAEKKIFKNSFVK